MRSWMGLVLLMAGCERSFTAIDGGSVCSDDRWGSAEPAGPVLPDEAFVLYAEQGFACNTLLDGMICVVEVDGTDITLSTVADYTRPGRMPWAAVNDCALVMRAACEIPALDEGTYTVTYGDSSRGLNVPGEPWAECLSAYNPESDGA